jgi:o-succinylbenzoate synthase
MKKMAAFLQKHTLEFKFEAKTSRNAFQTKDIFLIEISDNYGRLGVGEIAPLEGLSPEFNEHFEEKLKEVLANVEHYLHHLDDLADYPSIIFGLETAWWAYKNSNGIFFNTDFTNKKRALPINSLVWMGDFDFMKSQIDAILKQETKCIKIKVGGIDFEQEIELLKYIRRFRSAKTLQLRLDANGAFRPDNVIEIFEKLIPFDIHSIEQPIAKGQINDMRLVVETGKIPIALDEELIGVTQYKDRYQLLKEINPSYIVLKPSLHGGFRGVEEWIFIARQLGIRWWVTSALESNLGLNAIAQWVSQFPEAYDFPQGLGTGQLYKNNLPAQSYIQDYFLYFGN